MIFNFFRGIAALPRGAAFFLKRPALWPLGFVPVLLTVLIFGGVGVGYFFLIERLFEWLATILPDAQWLETGARWLVHIILWVLFVLLTWITFLQVVDVIGAPWNDRLVGRIEKIVKGSSTKDDTGVAQQLADFGTGVRHAMGRLTIYWALYLPLVLLNFIPVGVTTVLFLVIGIPWSAYFVALSFSDVVESRKRKSFKEKFQTVNRNLPAMMGFGGATYAILLVPFVNVLSIPFAVTGMTLLYLEQVDS